MPGGIGFGAGFGAGPLGKAQFESMDEETARTSLDAFLEVLQQTWTPVFAEGDREGAVFDGKGECASCHRVSGVGSRVGPDLTSIGQRRSAGELMRSVVEPGADVDPANRFYRVVLRDGSTVTGRLLGHDTFTQSVAWARGGSPFGL